MKELLALSICVVVPLIPVMIEAWIERNQPQEEDYEHSYY